MDIANQKSKVDGPDAYRMTALGRQPHVVKQLFSDSSAETVTAIPNTPKLRTENGAAMVYHTQISIH